jgi:DNA topoisomerase-1
VLAGVVGLLDATSTRVGNEEYVQQNNSYGLTTLRDRHVTVGRGSIEIRFVGKGGFRKEAVIDDKPLMRIVKECREVRGAHLFQYRDDEGKSHAIGAADVNDYLRETTGQEFTAKDFRTWKASALVAGTLYEYRHLDRVSKRRRILKTAVDDAAASLGNTPTIAKKYYIHPGLLESYQDGTFAELMGRFRPRRKERFSHEEQVLARFLKAWEAKPRGG